MQKKRKKEKETEESQGINVCPMLCFGLNFFWYSLKPPENT